MDNVRTVRTSVEDVWKAGFRHSPCRSCLGIQEETHKTLPPRNKKDSAWVVAMLISNHQSLLTPMTLKKWNKGQLLVNFFLYTVGEVNCPINRKTLERIRRFLGHLATIFPVTSTCLKGPHQTIEDLRLNQEPSGWKRSH